MQCSSNLLCPSLPYGGFDSLSLLAIYGYSSPSPPAGNRVYARAPASRHRSTPGQTRHRPRGI